MGVTDWEGIVSSNSLINQQEVEVLLQPKGKEMEVKVRKLQSGVLILIEIVSLLLLHAQASAQPTEFLRAMCCIALAVIILLVSCIRC